MKSSLSILIGLALLAMSCDKAANAVIEQTRQSVMAVHDEVMPKMAYTASLQKSLTTLRDSLAAAKQSTAELDSVLAALTSGEAAMNTWMEKFDPDFQKNLEPAKAMEYIAAQLGEVATMKTKLLTGITQAEAALSRYGRALPQAAAVESHDHGHGEKH